MALPRRLAAAALLAFLLLPSPAGAHGGRYQGPIEEVPPDGWSPEDLYADGYHSTRGTTFESWRFAWHAVENAVLEERWSTASLAGDPLTARIIEERVLPALLAFARDDRRAYGLTGEAILDLGRNGVAAAIPDLRGWALNRDPGEQRHRVDEECSVLALGLLPDPGGESRALLRRILGDPDARGRSRAFAAVALALAERDSGTPGSLEALRTRSALAAALDTAHRDLDAAASFALGRLGGVEAADLLMERLDRPAPRGRRTPPGWSVNEDLARAHAAAALGRAAAGVGEERERAALALLRAEVRRGRRLPAIGAVVGLGRLGAGAGEETAAACAELLDDLLRSRPTWPHARRRAVLSLAMVAAGRGDGVRGAALASLRAALEARRPDLSWPALGLGLALRNASPAERAAAGDRMRDLLYAEGGRDGREGPDRPATEFLERAGGGVVALGLLRHLPSRPALEALLLDAGEDRRLRALAAEALGLLGDGAALPALRMVAAGKRDREMKREVCLGLALLGDTGSAPELLDVLRDPKCSRWVLGGCAQALGRLGGEEEARALLDLVVDDDYPDLTRATAVQALGRMAARGRPDPFAPLAEDGLYRLCTDPLFELWGLL